MAATNVKPANTKPTKKKKKPPKRLFRVEIDMKYTLEKVVSARTTSEAQHKALEYFKKHFKYSDFNYDTEKEPEY